jgi:hypothetical protein
MRKSINISEFTLPMIRKWVNARAGLDRELNKCLSAEFSCHMGITFTVHLDTIDIFSYRSRKVIIHNLFMNGYHDILLR